MDTPPRDIEKDKAYFIEQVRLVLVAQYNRRIVEADRIYRDLWAWCDRTQYDFGVNYNGAIKYLQKDACGIHDSAAFSGGQIRQDEDE